MLIKRRHPRRRMRKTAVTVYSLQERSLIW
jgi:hypothetical protein